MGLDVYLSWDGGFYKDQAVQDGDGPDWYDEPFEHGRQGQLRGWRWWELLFKPESTDGRREDRGRG